MHSDNTIGSELEKRRKDPIFMDSMVPLKKVNTGFDFSLASNILAEQSGLMANNNMVNKANEVMENKQKKLRQNKLNGNGSNEKNKKSAEFKKKVTDKANLLLDKFKQSMQ